MAVTSLWAVKNRIDHVVDYTKDKNKTVNRDYGNKDMFYDLTDTFNYAINRDKTEKQYYVTGINCDANNAVKEMVDVKKKYNKLGGILAFHGIQSFKKDEIIPEIAHEVGVKLAEEMWGDRFQVIVTTHLNTEHIHNHFVLNSVSFKDGYKYYSNYENTGIMRQISDDICREYGLSVLEDSKCRKVDFNYFYNKNISNDNYYTFVKDDIDFAVRKAFTFDEFKKILSNMGYKFYFGAEQLCIKMPPRKRYIRVEKSFGEDYSLQKIKERIFDYSIDKRYGYNPVAKTLFGRYIAQSSLKSKKRITGIRALYYHYCYLLKVYTKKSLGNKLSYQMRLEVKNMEKYVNQLRFLNKYNICKICDLDNVNKIKRKELQEAYNCRNRLYYNRNKEDDKEIFYEEISKATEVINKLKSELKICDDIEKNIFKIKEQLKEFYEKEAEIEENIKNKKKLNIDKVVK